MTQAHSLTTLATKLRARISDLNEADLRMFGVGYTAGAERRRVAIEVLSDVVEAIEQTVAEESRDQAPCR